MPAEKLTRKQMLQGLGLTAAGAAIAACAAPPAAAPQVIKETVVVESTVIVPGTPEVVEVTKEITVAAPTAQAPVTIRWWSYYGVNDRCLTCGTMAKTFEDQNPGVTVELSHGAADYSTKLATAFASGDPPELAGTTHTTMLVQISDGAILPLDDWYVQSGTKDRMHPAALAWNTTDGKLSAGVKEPTTKDELYQVVKDLDGKVKFPFLFAGMSTWLWPELMSLIQAQTTGITLIEQGTAKKDYHIPELGQAVDLFAEMWKNIVPDAALGIEANDSITTFANGEVGIISYHTAWLAGIKAAVSQAGKVILGSFADPVLFVDQPKSPWPAGYGSCFVVPKQNKYLTETFALMSSIWSVDSQRSLAGAGLGIPPLPETWDAITDPLYQNAIKHIGQSTPEALFWVDFMHPRVNEALYTSLLALVKGEGTSDQVLDAMTEAIQAV
jgi:raffinose/stachyose/melibiose transport system substrate-binding protein